MAESRANRKKDIAALLAERKTLEAWLAQLDERRTSFSAHVLARVEADYLERLSAARAELAGEADGLKEIVAQLETRLSSEREDAAAKADERAEAELRALVGEFDGARWTRMRGALDAAVAEVERKCAATEGELAQVREVLSSIESAPAAPRPSAVQAAVEAVDVDLMRADAAAERAAGLTGADQTGDADEGGLAATAEGDPVVAGFGDAPNPEQSGVEVAADVGGAGAVTPDDAGGTGAQEPAPSAAEPFDELAFLRSVAATPTAPRGTSPVGAIPVTVATPRRNAPNAVGGAEAAPQPAVPPAPVAATDAEPDSAAPLGAPTPRTSQAVRTLKCQECGTLNFPTEWYCERCGGELAAF